MYNTVIIRVCSFLLTNLYLVHMDGKIEVPRFLFKCFEFSNRKLGCPKPFARSRNQQSRCSPHTAPPTPGILGFAQVVLVSPSFFLSYMLKNLTFPDRTVNVWVLNFKNHDTMRVLKSTLSVLSNITLCSVMFS